jgi:hypothetical protein
MVITAALTALEQASKAADYPLICGVHALRAAGAKWTLTGLYSSTDLSDPDMPAWRACDATHHLRTRPGSLGADWYIVFNLAAPLPDYDCLALLNHSIDPALLTRIDAEAADDAAFSSGLTNVLVNQTVITAARHIYLTLGDSGPLRFSEARYLRIRIRTSVSLQPEIGEVWLGRRRQLNQAPDRPHDHLGLTSRLVTSNGNGYSDVVQAGAYGGEVGIAGRADFPLSIRGIYGSDIRSLHAECGYASRPVLVVPKPQSDPHRAIVMQLETGISVRTVADPSLEAADLRLHEIAPLYVDD